MASALAAVKQTPELLNATPRSLFASVTKSAQDGLLPDGREGVIVVYREKQRGGGAQNTAQWNPMTYGLRRRARELDGLIVSAHVCTPAIYSSGRRGIGPGSSTGRPGSTSRAAK